MVDDNELMIILRDINRWLKILAYDKVKKILLDTLKTEKEIKIYHYSDGRSSIEVAKAVGLKSHASILEYWKRWGRIGIMDVITVRGGRRYVKAFNLEDFGIEIPTNNRGDVDA